MATRRHFSLVLDSSRSIAEAAKSIGVHEMTLGRRKREPDARTSHDVIVQSIAATTARSGLTVHAELDTDTYPTGVKIPDTQIKALHDTGALHRHHWHPEWNYTLHPPQK